MNIPKRIHDRAELAWQASGVPGNRLRGNAYQVIAEWARKEALREAADVAFRREFHGASRKQIVDALRALAEGEAQ